jgi:predicted DNA-binding transcriptional regulator YafY
MKNRLARLLKVLEWYPRTGAPDVDSIALQLGTTPGTVRRDLRDLREAGAFDGANRPRLASPPDVPVAVAAPETPAQQTLPSISLAESVPANDAPARRANDVNAPERAEDRDEELVAMYIGARFLASEGDAALGEQALQISRHVEDLASPALLERLAELDTRFRFGPRNAERRVRAVVAQAITERRAVRVRYKGERDSDYRERVVEPSAQFFIHDRWSFYAYDRESDEVRQFRHERCKDVTLTDEPYTAKSHRGIDGFVAQRRRAGR